MTVPVQRTPDWERRVAGAINRIEAVTAQQQPAIADDASGAANQATVNAILAALRAHGLIAR